MLLSRLTLLLTIVFAGLAGSALEAAPPPEFVATYRVEKSGLAGRMIMTLRRDGSMWHFETHSEPIGILALFDRAYVTESTVLEQWGSMLRPVTYAFSAEKKPSKRDVASTFDWENGILKSSRGSTSRSTELQSGTFDRLSVLLEIAARLRAGVASMDIPVATQKGKILVRRFVREEEEEMIKVAGGKFKTARVRQLRGKSKRYLVSWFAADQHYLPVRMDQFRLDEHLVRAELINVEWHTEGTEKAAP